LTAYPGLKRRPCAWPNFSLCAGYFPMPSNRGIGWSTNLATFSENQSGRKAASNCRRGT